MPTDHTIDFQGKGKPVARRRQTDFPPGLSWRDWFTAVGERFGFPIACLIAVSAGLTLAGRWFAIEIAKPVAERHIRFVDALESERSDDKKMLRDISEKLGELTNQQRLTNQILRKNGKGESP